MHAVHSLNLARWSHSSLCLQFPPRLPTRHDRWRTYHLHTACSAVPSTLRPALESSPVTCRRRTSRIVLHRILTLWLQIRRCIPGGDGRSMGCTLPKADEGIYTDWSRALPGGAGGMARSGNKAMGTASGWFRTQGSWLGSKERQIQFRNRWKGDHDSYGGVLSQ
jgi:hypothetical protein